jgi:hypothetical protein
MSGVRSWGVGVLPGVATEPGLLVCPPSAVQVLVAATQLLANATMVRMQSNSGAITLTATPTIPPGIDGQMLFVENVGGNGLITFQDRGTLAGSGLALQSATQGVAIRSWAMFIYSGAIGLWVQQYRSSIL